MATPYATAPPPAPAAAYEMRSVTPATKNGVGSSGANPSNGGGHRYPSAPIQRAQLDTSAGGNGALPHPMRSMTPTRYDNEQQRQQQPNTPSSNGLIRLSLKKPMGIVFEPMYDPNAPSVQRGVRICDLPRTGAAALSRKLQVGDELLQINDTTVSRMTFDEIMDFIIEADPESVNLLFRRPLKETLQARQGVQQKLNAALNKDNPSTVKWVDEERKDSKKKPKKKKSKRKTKEPSDEEETLQSSTAGEESYTKSRGSRRKHKSRSRGDPYGSESFLDVLIDTICSNSGGVCRDSFGGRDYDDDYSDEESLATGDEESTYVTYEESLEPRNKKSSGRTSDNETEDETLEEADRRRRRKNKSSSDHKNDKRKSKYDDETLETNESNDRVAQPAPSRPSPSRPLGLAQPPPPVPVTGEELDDKNPAPIREVEYDDRIDHAADVSVMESLGGPSLLIEKQRAAAAQQAAAAQKRSVPPEIMDKFGLDYPTNRGMTRQQTIEADPLKFYSFVVRRLLEEHEPEKVRLLDKLLAKYQGREDHLVQKLSVRYNRTDQENEPSMDEHEFSDAVKKSKAGTAAEVAVNTAKERMQSVPEQHQNGEYWPEKEQKEQDEGDEDVSASGSEYSRDSVDGTSPAVIAQVSELLNYVYGKTSVPGQIDRVSTIMRAYEGREAVLLELLETKALIKANKEKENADNLPAFLRNSHMAKAPEDMDAANNDSDLPPVTPMATQGAIHDDISSMSGVSTPAKEAAPVDASEEVEVKHFISTKEAKDPPMSTKDSSPTKVSSTSKGGKSSKKPPVTPDKKSKTKRGLFGGIFGKKKKDGGPATPGRSGSRSKGRRS